MLDGAAKISELVDEVANQNMPAIAMTDHGNVFGAFEFYKIAKAAKVKPIIGIEAYVAPESRFDKRRVKWAEGGEDDVSAGGAYTHMTILAENNKGLSNLFRLSSLASLCHPWPPMICTIPSIKMHQHMKFYFAYNPVQPLPTLRDLNLKTLNFI